MNLKQLIQTNSWQTVLPIFLTIYTEAEKNIKGYQTVFEKLITMPSEETDMTIIISREIDGDEEYVDVSGLLNNPKNKEETYSQGIEFTPWRKWLGMDVKKETLNSFSELEIIVHCLYEMTFVGFTEEAIREKMNKIEKSRIERESMTKEESDAVTLSVKELLNKWREKESD